MVNAIKGARTPEKGPDYYVVLAYESSTSTTLKVAGEGAGGWEEVGICPELHTLWQPIHRFLLFAVITGLQTAAGSRRRLRPAAQGNGALFSSSSCSRHQLIAFGGVSCL